MHKKMNLQLFAAPEGMTGKEQFATVSARDIDFVSSFSKDLKALLDVMGISRLIKKANGSTLRVLKGSGTLKSGAVAEGDEIPLSQFTVTESKIGTINIEKYRKGTSIEAIAEYGYDVAVQKTDDEMKSLLTDIVTSKFYTFLGTGTLTDTETTWQMGFAMAIGKVKHKFQTLKKAATGVAVFVNTLDVYKYLGGAAVTTQTAFGMTYIEGFLGADIAFLTDKVPQGKIYATPINNLIGYFVDPADSEFARAGLQFATDAETGFIGFHSEGNYSRAMSDAYALMGITLAAEYIDAIAVVTVSAG